LTSQRERGPRRASPVISNSKMSTASFFRLANPVGWSNNVRRSTKINVDSNEGGLRFSGIYL
jgi:hypothetical protein